MVLKEFFENSGYTNIINNLDAIKYKLFVDMFYEDKEKIPQEFKFLYISKTCDELFFVLDSRKQDISDLCEKWDRKISAFMTFGSSDKEIIKKLKYNVVQIVLYEEPIADRSEEGSLNITRKIFIPCIFSDNGSIEILDEEVVEIPFYLIEAGSFDKNIDLLDGLKKLLPTLENKRLDFLNVKRKLVSKRVENKITRKYYEEEEYNKIKEWLNTYGDTND